MQVQRQASYPYQTSQECETEFVKEAKRHSLESVNSTEETKLWEDMEKNRLYHTGGER